MILFDGTFKVGNTFQLKFEKQMPPPGFPANLSTLLVMSTCRLGSNWLVNGHVLMVAVHPYKECVSSMPKHPKASGVICSI